jgi:hypothetical protein
MVLFLWGALPDERTSLSYVYAVGPWERSLSRVRVPWDLRSYFTLSDLRLSFSSPPTTCRVTVEIFDPASTRVDRLNVSWSSLYNLGADRKENTIFYSCSVVACLSVKTFTWLLLSHCLATGRSTEPFPINGCLWWLHISGFLQTCHIIYDGNWFSNSSGISAVFFFGTESFI